MPRKTIHKEKSREYLERLLDNAGMTDKELVQTVVKALKSDNSIERSKALELAARWKGFADVDKKVEESVERLPIGNINLADLDRLSNRCAYCRHKRFEPLREATNKQEIPGIPEAAPDDPMDGPSHMLPSLQTDLPEENKQDKKESVNPDVKYRIGGKLVSREEFYSIKDNEQNKEKAPDTGTVIGNSQD